MANILLRYLNVWTLLICVDILLLFWFLDFLSVFIIIPAYRINIWLRLNSRCVYCNNIYITSVALNLMNYTWMCSKWPSNSLSLHRKNVSDTKEYSREDWKRRQNERSTGAAGDLFRIRVGAGRGASNATLENSLVSSSPLAEICWREWDPLSIWIMHGYTALSPKENACNAIASFSSALYATCQTNSKLYM